MLYENSFVFDNKKYYYCDLKKILNEYESLKKLPISLKILLENSIRNAKTEDIKSIIDVFIKKESFGHLSFKANRVIMKESLALSTLLELVSLNDRLDENNKLEFKIAVDVVLEDSLDIQGDLIKEKEIFCQHLQNTFKKLSIIDSSSNKSSKVNLDYLSTLITLQNKDDKSYIYQEALLGNDYHTSISAALGILALKAKEYNIQEAILGSSLDFMYPKVIGIHITGSFSQGISAKELLINLENFLKQYKLKNKIIEFYGKALKNISIEVRASISDMLSKYEVLSSYFCFDCITLAYIERTRGLDISLIKNYYSLQGIYAYKDIAKVENLEYDESLAFDLSSIKALIKGPKSFLSNIEVSEVKKELNSFKKGDLIKDNDILLACILCTNRNNKQESLEANLSLIIQAALLSKNACTLGLSINKNIRRYLLLDSLELKLYLQNLDLLKYLEALGFELIYNKSIKNLDTTIDNTLIQDIEKFNLNVSSLYTQNNELIDEKDFQTSFDKQIKSKWLLSPALLIVYCLKGNMNVDISLESITQDIYLSDIWPSINEVNEYINKVDYSVYKDLYNNVFKNTVTLETNENYKNSKNIQKPELFHDLDEVEKDKIEILNAKVLALLGDKVSSAQISPLGQIPPYSVASKYLEEKDVKAYDFNTFKSRSLSSHLMSRATFCNINLENEMVKPKEGGYTKDYETNEIIPIFEFASKMKNLDIPLVVFAGEEFGTGSKRSWASKGLKTLGIKAVIAKSFDEEYKKELIANGILPCEFIDDDIKSLNLLGDEEISLQTKGLKIDDKINLVIKKNDEVREFLVLSKLETKTELDYYKNAGALENFVK